MYAVCLPFTRGKRCLPHLSSLSSLQFVNSAAGTGSAPAPVAHGLSTKDFGVRSHIVQNPNVRDPGNVRSRVVLVDTPGLNNSNTKYSDTEIIKSIASWLND